MWHQLCKEALKSHGSKSYCCDHRTFWDSFLLDLVHFLTSQITSFTNCRCCSTTAFPEPWVFAGRLFEKQCCHFTIWALLIHEHGKSFCCLVYHSVYFFKVSKFSLWRLFTFLVDSLELFDTFMKEIFFLISILANFLLLIKKSTYILCRFYI